MRTKESNFFWPSYADLMTSLFFIMLVLYVLTFVKLKLQQKATEEQLNKIKEIQNAVKELPKQYFKYDERNKRFELIQQISFEKGKSTIQPEYSDYLFKVGLSIENLIKNLESKKKSENLTNIKYLVVIEGMASNDQYQLNYELSYERALSLFNFWKNKAINFDPDICEVQIAGSGIGGVGRDAIEINNQRFLIQIIPKIGEIK
jgi:outer membrane protein OmpA-like peptidoglycan-associated protein